MVPPPPALVLLAAGLGTRYGGLKQLDPVGPGRTAVLDYALADAARAGLERAVLVVRPETEEELRAHLARTGSAPADVVFVHQTLRTGLPTGTSPPPGRARPWGTAHAVLAAAPELAGPFAVANADDHYGVGAWACLGGWLSRESRRPRDAAVVGYRLSRTLSEHGGVSRGICVPGGEGLLRRVREAVAVRREGGGGVTGVLDGERRSLDAEAWVSMNLWGFGPEILPLLREAFRSFLARGPERGEELHLPDVVGRAVARGELGVRLLPCGGEWFGMTHPGDRAEVARRLAERGPPPSVPSPA